MTICASAPSTTDRAAPASTSLTGSLPRRTPPSSSTSSPAAAAPPRANRKYPAGWMTPKTVIATATASAEPAFTPRMPGSASGFRVRDCMTTPAAPRAAPESTARIILGMRVWSRMRCASSSAENRVATPHRSEGASIRVPTSVLSAMAAITMSARIVVPAMKAARLGVRGVDRAGRWSAAPGSTAPSARSVEGELTGRSSPARPRRSRWRCRGPCGRSSVRVRRPARHAPRGRSP